MNAPFDLTNCDREPIHLLGNVQPFGFLLGVSPEFVIIHASENTERFFGATAGSLLGKSLSSVFTPEAIHTIRGRLQLLSGPDAVERVFRLQLTGRDNDAYDIALHRTKQAIFIEAEPSAPREEIDPITLVRTMLMRPSSSPMA